MIGWIGQRTARAFPGTGLLSLGVALLALLAVLALSAFPRSQAPAPSMDSLSAALSNLLPEPRESPASSRTDSPTAPDPSAPESNLIRFVYDLKEPALLFPRDQLDSVAHYMDQCQQGMSDACESLVARFGR
jgi:hypothetical protein